MKLNWKYPLLVFIACIFNYYLSLAQVTKRNLLSRFSKEQIAQSLLPAGQWKPFPQTAEAWKAVLPDSTIQQIIHDGEQYLNKPFATIPASVMLDFKRTGIRTTYEDLSFGKRYQLFSLVLAEMVEGKGRFTESIMNGIWSLCEESYWGINAHLYLQNDNSGLADVDDPSVDLFVSETAAILALTDYLVGSQLDAISPLLRKRIYEEVNTRMLLPLEKNSDRFGYLGGTDGRRVVNNWNPWVISNWITALLLLEKNETRRVQELHHALILLDNYINGLGTDGAVDEGPSYWFGAVGKLFDALNMLESATSGKLSIYNEPVIRLSGSYIYKMHIAGNNFISIADAAPKISADGLLLYRIGKAVNDTAMKDFGVWAYHHIDDNPVLSKEFARPRKLWNLLALEEVAAKQAIDPVLKDAWLESIQVMVARSANGLMVAAHGGHNAESHNHNDVGDVLVYSHGKPVIIDVGAGTYTAKTFSNERYSLWYNSTAYHNLPVINGVQQQAGKEFEAKQVHYTANDKKAQLQMDIGAAWPAAAGVQQWKRTVTLDKEHNRASVTDEYKLDKPATQLTQTFMTSCVTTISQPGKIIFDVPNEKPVQLEYDARSWEVTKEELLLTQPDEKRIADNWNNGPLWRILLNSKGNKKEGKFLYTISESNTLTQQQQAPYQDVTHESKVFGHKKTYRLYLPAEYTSSTTRYPVIYFFHGWGGRYFKDDNAKLAYEKIKTLVDKYKVILVMWDGSMDEAEPRPYNIGSHADVKYEVQMKDYFPELVQHIDGAYRTLTDRQHRGIIGFSMGGIMSLFLAGKYPDMVSAAVSLTGSPEFFIGYPSNHTLYPVRYAFKNLEQVSTRMHTGDSDVLYYLNEEVHAGAKWEGVPIEYYKFHGGHMVDDSGKTKVFEMAMQFVANAFKKETPAPASWSHYDLYPDFNVWGYTVTSNKQQPGYIYLKNVTKNGFGLYTTRWLPDGPALEINPISVTTSPVYEPGKMYELIQYSAKEDNLYYGAIKADEKGRLHFLLSGDGYETGIYEKRDGPDVVLWNYAVNNKSRFLTAGIDNQLSLRLLNLGGENYLPANAQVTLSTTDSSIIIKDPVKTIQITEGNRRLPLPAYTITCSTKPPPHAEPPFIKFIVTIKTGNKITRNDIIVPVLFNVPLFTNVTIDDGKAVKDKTLGKGNANGEANAGEQVVAFSGDHRLRLYTEDPFVIREQEQPLDEIIPARWPDGYSVSSLIKIAPECPDGHIIECMASYETKEFNPIERKVTWGKVRIVVNKSNK
jgi:enterochelin esterase-like enzyme